MKYFAVIILLIIIFSDAYSQDNQIMMLKNIYNSPFFDKNILFPNYWYNDYDELFNHIGIPIKEFPPFQHESLPLIRSFEFEEYNIYTMYNAHDILIIFLIFIKMENELIYNIKKNDAPEKIIDLLGEPLRITLLNEDIVEYEYRIHNDGIHIRFQFNNNKLSTTVIDLRN
jgi:hypothetical protein